MSEGDGNSKGDSEEIENIEMFLFSSKKDEKGLEKQEVLKERKGQKRGFPQFLQVS